ncbi:olee1-like protein [Prosopis cineraria]|uniref:olee1-like protein n=1 Tax=Prosopis cineraria TaxID=364024 RepID=UPI00240F3D95|nr:olee1-like protein [Prosopis cineraria]
MGKPSSLVTLIVSTLCFSALLEFAHGDNGTYNIQGRIYCDPCRFQQETRSSIPLKGVKVILQCKTSEEGNMTYTNTGLTDQNGVYTIPMNDNHENNYCEISTDQTTHPSCTETVAAKGDRVTLINTNVLSFSTRFVRPLGFMSKEYDPRCALMVKEYDIFNIKVDD